MMTAELLDKLNELGKKIRGNRLKPFGGIQILLVGDFYQLPPVTKGTTTNVGSGVRGHEVRGGVGTRPGGPPAESVVELVLIVVVEGDAVLLRQGGVLVVF